MTMSAEQQEFAIELSQLREQIKFVASDIGDIKTAISQIVTLDKTLAELTIHNQMAQKNMDALWTKYDELKTKTTTIDHEVKSFVNRFRGGALVMGVMGGAVQAAVFGVTMWVFSHVTDNDIVNKLQQQRIEQLEKRLEAVGVKQP
jgi:hypothetical protein